MAGQFLPMPKMLPNLYNLVSIAKAAASNPIDLRRELGKIKHAPGLHAMDTLLRGAITGAQFVMDFPDVMRAVCGQDEDGMAFSSMKPARRNDLLRAASAAGFLEVTKVLLACGAELDGEEFAGSGMTALMHTSLGGHTSVIEALIAKGAEVNLVQNEMALLFREKCSLSRMPDLTRNDGFRYALLGAMPGASQRFPSNVGITGSLHTALTLASLSTRRQSTP